MNKDLKHYILNNSRHEFTFNFEIKLYIKFYTNEIKDALIRNINISYNEEGNELVFTHCNVLDLLALLFDNSEDDDGDFSLYYLYIRLSKYHRKHYNVPCIEFIKMNDNAITPFKSRASDAGFDLTIISHIKQLTDNTALFGTGIKIKIPIGYYCTIVGRSSISKTGYMLANNLAIIDLNYRGELMIALTKHDNSMPDIELPMRIGQLILTPYQHSVMKEVKEFDSQTQRGSGGFGSTN